MVIGKSGCRSRPPPKLCASLVREQVLQPRVERLREVKLFASVSDDDIEGAARLLKVVEYDKDTHIIRQGETGADLFLIEEGTAYAEIKVGEEWKVVKEYPEGHILQTCAS